MASNARRAAGSASRAAARSGGTVTVRGAVSGWSSTSTSSPADTPAAARTWALTGSRNRPPMEPTLLR